MIDLEQLLEQLMFKNNPKLRPCNAKIPYTTEMAIEYSKCKADPIYFIENYVHVIHPDRGIVLMKLYDYQKEMIRLYQQNRFCLSKTSRQMGKTTVAAAFFVWFVIFHKAQNVAILANKQKTADEIVSRFKLAYELLPKWLQQGVKTWNKRTVELENDSKVFSSATSSSGIRGNSVNVLYLDEMAFIPNNQAEDFFTSVYPTITASLNSKVIITSTPNGYNMFYKFWNEAEQKKNGFVTLSALWNEIPGRTQEWYDEQAAILGPLKAAQELDACFLGSSMQLLSNAAMSALSPNTPIKTFTQGDYHGLLIYENPIPGHNYVMTVDVSRGRHLDSSAFMIFDVSSKPNKIVASYNNFQVSPLMYSGIIHTIATQYNEAYILVEINDVGAQVADDLYYSYEYGNLFWTKSGDTLGKRGADPFPGIRTTKKTKRIGCSNLKDMIEKQQLVVSDLIAITELSTFVQSRSGVYSADEGFHDDAVMCLVMFAWLAVQPWFNDLFDKNIKSDMYSELIHQMETDLRLFSHNDGLSNDEEEFGRLF